MPTVQPPPPPPPGSAVPQSNPAAAVAVKTPEGVRAALNQLNPGQSLQATQPPQATQSLPPNQLQVQTTFGPITLQTALAVPKNAVLTLTLTTLSPQPAFLISEINGKPVPAAQAALKPATNGTQAVTPPTPPALSKGDRVSATLVRPVQVSPQPAATPQPQAQTTSVQPTQTTASTIAQPQTATAQPPSTTTGAAQTPVATTSTPAPPSTPTSQAASQAPQTAPQAPQTALPTGTRFTVSVMRVDTPSAVMSTPGPAASGILSQGTTLTGTVTGTTPQGQPIVQTPHATIALETRAPVTQGAKVVLKVDTAPVPPNTTDAANKLGRASPAQTMVQARAWSDLDEALKSLSQVDPGRFLQVAQHALPQPGPKLSSQMLFFLSALKGGDIKAWLGDNAGRVIDRDRPGLMNRLGGDFQVMARMSDEPQSGDWRLALIPLWGENKLDQLRMYYRGHNGSDDDGGDDDGIRFILDLELSNLGHIQIDGLVKAEKQKFDVLIRTEEPLPDHWRGEIGDIFIAAQEIAGLNGGVGFQAAPGNFVEFPPIDPITPHPGLYA